MSCRHVWQKKATQYAGDGGGCIGYLREVPIMLLTEYLTSPRTTGVPGLV
jgi:hypothetical protein